MLSSCHNLQWSVLLSDNIPCRHIFPTGSSEIMRFTGTTLSPSLFFQINWNDDPKSWMWQGSHKHQNWNGLSTWFLFCKVSPKNSLMLRDLVSELSQMWKEPVVNWNNHSRAQIGNQHAQISAYGMCELSAFMVLPLEGWGISQLLEQQSLANLFKIKSWSF